MRRREAGYAFLIVLLLAAMVLISLSVAVPRILTQGQRMKEDELIFRGQEYQKAIGRFYRKFGRYPNSIEELLRTNDRAFLRREYPDPMTEDGKWRLIRVAPNGALIGSVTRRIPAGAGGEQAEEGEEEDESDSPPPETDTDDSNLPIAGVASRSHARSIKVYNGFSTYYEWEFIYDAVQDAAGRAGQGQQPPSGQPPGEGQTRPPYPPRR